MEGEGGRRMDAGYINEPKVELHLSQAHIEEVADLKESPCPHGSYCNLSQ